MSSPIKPLKGVRKVITLKFQSFLLGYENLMLKRFPATYRMLQMFTVGTKSFIKDVFDYVRISKDLTFDRSLNYKELLLYQKTPKDIRKMLPFLLLSALPLAQYVTLPVAVMLPKMLLSSHYWSIEQRDKFALQDHISRLRHYRPIFRSLQYNFAERSQEFGDLKDSCQLAFAKLGSGTHPSVDLLLELRPLFVYHQPYGLDELSFGHLYHLCRIHNLSVLPGRKQRVKQYLNFVRMLDKTLQQEGFDDLNLEDLKTACFMRGLNPINMQRNEMLGWLENWQHLSTQVDEANLSLLAHAPVLLAYNNPSNWRLIH